MAHKATHEGHCQVCGRLQKLPGGLLAKHGYERKWGFFNGVCWGAENVPFEKDKSLVEKAIASVQEDLDAVNALITKLETEEDPEKFHVDYYDRNQYRTVHAWAEKANVEEHDGSWVVTLNPGTPNERRLSLGYVFGTLAERLHTHNKEYARKLGFTERRQYASYIAWQQERIRDWEPAPLIPVRG